MLGTQSGSSFILVPTFTSLVIGVEYMTFSIPSSTSLRDSDGINVPSHASATAFNLTRDPRLDATFSGSISFPPDNLIVSADNKIRIRWYAPDGVDSDSVWLQMEL